MNKLYYILLLLLLWACSDKKEIKLTVQKDKLLIENLTKLANYDLVNIYVWDSDLNQPTEYPLEGNYKKDGDNVVAFTPNFPLLHNTQYVLIASTTRGKIQKRFTLPKQKMTPLEVSTIYPTADTLPENLLRAYIEFSQPMKTTNNLEHIKLINSKGEEIKGAIFNNAYELWDTSQKRLTIIFDPARVKTDLVANKNLGRALQPGEQFSIKIDSLQDIYGQKLQQTYIKTFNVVNQDTISPNVNDWTFELPKSNTKKPLQIQFKAAIDRMSLFSRIGLIDKDEKPIKGKIEIKNNEKGWYFVPESKWKTGEYQIIVNSRLEDPSGNNLNGLFDHKVGSLKSEKEGELISIRIKIH
ncbi:hypothetical protein [Aquimarina mytili]|uniref:SbsA Ig-like domain-containing protein n=1 Tax=Aquimarina mytili TaxID=874423 RepID=A0A936ZVY5_9FLAO|nr:hypothetical protein [Aquimarina mytili]MBL0682928.1 hypothetical protein [Aquimarina mytili]